MNNRFPWRRPLLATILGTTAMTMPHFTAPAMAQTADEASADNTIIVTAQRRA